MNILTTFGLALYCVTMWYLGYSLWKGDLPWRVDGKLDGRIVCWIFAPIMTPAWYIDMFIAGRFF